MQLPCVLGGGYQSSAIVLKFKVFTGRKNIFTFYPRNIETDRPDGKSLQYTVHSAVYSLFVCYTTHSHVVTYWLGLHSNRSSTSVSFSKIEHLLSTSRLTPLGFSIQVCFFRKSWTLVAFSDARLRKSTWKKMREIQKSSYTTARHFWRLNQRLLALYFDIILLYVWFHFKILLFHNGSQEWANQNQNQTVLYINRLSKCVYAVGMVRVSAKLYIWNNGGRVSNMFGYERQCYSNPGKPRFKILSQF